METENRTLKLEDLHEGMKVKIRSSNMAHPDAYYKGIVKKIFDKYTLFEVTVIQETMHDSKFGNASPYMVTILNKDFKLKGTEVYAVA